VRFRTLAEWLRWQETLHPRAIDLGLERVRPVAAALDLLHPGVPVVTIAGTNAKGSCAALLEAVMRAAGWRVGCYTSPHVLRYNERVRVDGEPVEDGALMSAFEAVDRGRGDTSLTYFEFGTLAAMEIFRRAAPDLLVLEVGLGGRLDAVNLFDADVALLSSLAVDHVAWLGSDPARIALEKAGILRAGRPAVCGEPAPPAALGAYARDLGATLLVAGRDFTAEAEPGAPGAWRFRARFAGSGTARDALPPPGIPGPCQRDNAACVLAVVALLGERLPAGDAAVRRGLAGARLAARCQVLPGDVPRVVDVAHNPQAARALADFLRATRCAGRTIAVVGMLADKDAAGVAAALDGAVDAWHAGGLDVTRGLAGADLAARLAGVRLRGPVHAHRDVAAAHAAALTSARAGDRLVVLGSFHTAAEALRLAACAGAPDTPGHG